MDMSTHEPSIHSGGSADAFLSSFNFSGVSDFGTSSSNDSDEIGGFDDPSFATSQPVVNSLPTHSLPTFRTGSRTLQELCHILKSQSALSEKAEGELDAFAAMTDPEQRLAQFSVSLQIRDLLKESRKAESESFSLSDKLKESIKMYARAFLLSPKVTAYRGNNANFILAAMRDLNVQELPPVKEIAQNREVLQFIGKQLTNFRSVMKDKIKNSMAENSSLRNIADLTFSLANGVGVQVTVQHYMRVAFLRWAVVYYKKVSEGLFWSKVDETLDELRRKLGTEVALTRAFKEKYDDDKAKYGDPADTAHQVVEPNKVVDWQTVLFDYSSKVQGGNKKRKV